MEGVHRDGILGSELSLYKDGKLSGRVLVGGGTPLLTCSAIENQIAVGVGADMTGKGR